MVRQSPNDNNKYLVLNLSNKLTVLLVHDDEAQKSAACCNVSIGSFADPIDAMGLAHFLEHMLFMGTESFPDENDCVSYLNAHHIFIVSIHSSILVHSPLHLHV